MTKEQREEMERLAYEECKDQCYSTDTAMGFYKAGFTAGVELAEKRAQVLTGSFAALIENSDCRGDEDCDHCVAVSALIQYEKGVADE